MQEQLLAWLNTNQDQCVDTNDAKHRLTINPKGGFVSIKYWEPSPIKGTELSIWKIISEIKVSHEFLQDHKNYDGISEILFKKLEMGGNYEITNENHQG